MNVLEGVKLSFSYQDKMIFENINIDVAKNEVVALLGTSGIGKTTLLNILAGLIKPQVGDVYLNTENITNKSGHVGYMLQRDLLLEFKTIVDNVSLPLILKGTKKELARKQAISYFEKFNLKGCEDYYPFKLSGGMKQRAAFLRTFLYNNQIMLLDEPFSALDAITKNDLYDWFRTTINELETSVLFITHDIDEAIRLADKIYILVDDDGVRLKEIKIAGNDNKDFVLTNEFLIYKKNILSII